MSKTCPTPKLKSYKTEDAAFGNAPMQNMVPAEIPHLCINVSCGGYHVK